MNATPDSTLSDRSRTIADLRRELAECKGERDAALAREAATAEVLKVINSSPGDLAPVFDAMLDRAIRLCEATHGHLFTYDGERFHPSAARGDPRYIEWAREAGPVRPYPNAPLGRIKRGERIVHVADIREEEVYRVVPTFRQSAELRGVCSQITVALLKDNVLLGAIVVYRQEVRPFSEQQIALLQNFAAQAVIAMENARLLTETREALEQQTATAEVLGVINSSPGNLKPVFEAMLEKAVRLCGAAHATLRIFDGELLHLAAVHGEPDLADRLGQLGPIEVGRIPVDDPLSRILHGERVVHTSDIRETHAYREIRVARERLEIAGLRTSLVVALHNGNALLGVISAYRKEVHPFSDKQIALLQNFAAQAVIAMENARLLTETREALEQQTATAEVLQVINSSPGDLAPVFDAMLDKATRLCEAPLGTLFAYEGDCFRAVATRGVPEAFADSLRAPIHPAPGAALERMVRGERFSHFTDVAAEDAYAPSNPAARALVELGGARTALAVPLRKDDTLLGAFAVYRQEVRPFSDKQIALVENFAAQAVIAMQNARLLTETREALKQQTATAEVLQVINSSPGNLTPVFDAILEKAHILCGAAIGALVVRDGDVFRTVATHGLPEQFDKLLRQPLPVHTTGGLHERLLLGERLIHIPDQAASEQTNPWSRASVEIAGTRTLLAIALRKDDALLGYITASRQEVRPFSDKQIALLENFAAQAVIAMENARLLTETREALEQQTATAEVLHVINSSPGDLAPVFDAMLEKAIRLCGGIRGVLWTIEGERGRLAASRGLSDEFVALLREHGESGTNPMLQRVINGEHLFQFNVPEHELYRSGDRLAKAAFGAGVRTLIWVALVSEGVAVGAFAIGRSELRPFSDKEIALLQNFAAQAVIAMENARLITETREALEQQTATAEVLGVINSSPGNLTPVFDAMLDKALDLCGAAFGNLWTFDGERFRAAALRRVPEAYVDILSRETVPPRPGTVLGHIAAGKAFAQIPDAVLEDAYMSTDARTLVELGGGRTVVGVALRKEMSLLGAITIFRQEVRPFTDKQIEVLQYFAQQAVIAMENARLLGELRQRTDEVAELNRGLEARVAEQVEELGRIGRLKRFLAPQLAELIVSQGDERILESHRREIVVVFCDLRGYTAFTETAEPEEVLEFLREYHGALGPLVSQFEGTLDQFSGDGIMVFFNDPLPCPDPAERAVNMAMAMREAAGRLIAAWRRHGCELGFGAGIAQGYATLGQIGFSERSGYTAIGTVCNLAARLCAEARDGQILVSSRIAGAVEAVARLDDLGNLELKGLRRPVAAFNVTELISGAPARA